MGGSRPGAGDRRWERRSPSARAGRAGSTVSSGRALVCGTCSRSTSRAVPEPSSRAKMPALHIEDLPEKEKLKMEVEQLRKEVKLQRQQASLMSQNISLCEMNQDWCCPVCCSKTNSFLALGWVWGVGGRVVCFYGGA